MDSAEFNFDEFKQNVSALFFNQQESSRDVISKMLEKASNDKKLFMFEVGDFDPRHYETIREELPCEHLENRNSFRFEMSVRFKYIATKKQRNAALNRLKDTYGKNWEELVKQFHPMAYFELILGCGNGRT